MNKEQNVLYFIKKEKYKNIFQINKLCYLIDILSYKLYIKLYTS